MTKLDLNAHLIPPHHLTPIEKINSEKITQKIVPPISIHNINAIFSPKPRSQAKATALKNAIQRVKNPLSTADSVSQKLHQYKTYFHYGNTPTSCQNELDTLEAALLIPDIKNSKYINLLQNLLPALKLMAEALLTLDSRNALPSSQLAGVNLRENVIRTLITSSSLLPDILLQTDRAKRARDALSIRHTLIEELIQGALNRLIAPSPSVEKEMRALLHAPPPSLHEKLEHFIADSHTALTTPLYNELRKHIQIIENATTNARRFLSRPSAASHPLPTDILYAIRMVSQSLETLTKQLRHSILPSSENKKIPQQYPSWLSSHGIEPAVPATKMLHTLHRGLNNASAALDKLHQHVNHEHLSPFPVAKLKPFLSLSHEERIHCIMMKKIANPLHDNADKLQQAAANLRKAIGNALQENGQLHFLSSTPEQALCIELTALTEHTPHSTLMLAINAARSTAQHILNTTYPSLDHPPRCAKFSAIVQEYSEVLRHGVHLLKNAVYQTEINFRQKTILSAILDAEKTASNVKHILNNALESVSSVTINSSFAWLRQLDIDLHSHWQGITALIGKARTDYILCGQGQQGLAPPTQIHLAVLPLLNEAEKLRGACQSLEMLLGSASTQDAIDNTTHKIKSRSLTRIIQAERFIQDRLSEKNNPIYLYYKHAECPPASLPDILRSETQSLLRTAHTLQETAWLLSWNTKDITVRQSLMHIRRRLTTIKKTIKDTVETATGVRPHINSPEGMIAKDAAEWLMALEKPPDANAHQDIHTALIDRLCEEFTSSHDPKGALFRLRITLAMHDAQQETLTWPLTPQEHLNTVRTPKDYTLAWAEKRLTYSMLYNCLIHYTPAALFSLNMVKSTLVSPLRLINLLLTPIRMAVTRRAMQKVRPGCSKPSDFIAEYTTREVYQAIFRAVSLLSPQLFKTMAATGITAYGLLQGGQYRHAFLTRAIARLPGDLFWVGGFAAWHQAVNVFHALQQQQTLSFEQITRLQEILNLPSIHKESVDSPQPTTPMRHACALIDDVEDENSNNIRQVTETTMRKTELNSFCKEKDILISSNSKLIFDTNLQTLLNKNIEIILTVYSLSRKKQEPHINETSLDWWRHEVGGQTHWAEKQTNIPNKMILKNDYGDEINLIKINNQYYLNDWEQQKTYLYAMLNGLAALPTPTKNVLDVILYKIFKTHPEIQPEEAIKIANTALSLLMYQEKSYAERIFKIKYSLLLACPNIDISMTLSELQENHAAIATDKLDKNIAFINSYYFLNVSQKKPKESKTVVLSTQIDEKSYSYDWKQQKDYFYATLSRLNKLPEQHKNILNDILYRVFKTNPKISPLDAIKVANTALSMLIFQNVDNSLYVNTISQIKYSLISAIPHTKNEFIDDIEREILHKLAIPINLEAVEKAYTLLDPTVIDTGKYLVAFTEYCRKSSYDSLSKLDNRDLYYQGIAACTKFLRSAPLNEKNNHYFFDKARLYFTQQQLTLLDKTVLTQEEKSKLIWLNIAKHHLYQVLNPPLETTKKEIHTRPSLLISSRLYDLSEHWKNTSTILWKEGSLGTEGSIYSISNRKYMYLRSMLWEIFEFSENHIAILAGKKDGKDNILEAIRVNTIWDIVSPKNTQESEFPENITSLALIKEDDQTIRTVSSGNSVTSRLLEISTQWKDSSAIPWKKKAQGENGNIYSISNTKYIYLRGLLWEIYQFAEDNIIILAEVDHKEVIPLCIRVNNVWDIVAPDTRPTSERLDINLASIQFYLRQYEVQKSTSEVTSLRWWLDTAWQNTEPVISEQPRFELDNSITMIGDKKYLNFSPYYWEYEISSDKNNMEGILKNRLGATLKIRFNAHDGQWYLNDWTQQQAYLTSSLKGLEMLSQDAQDMLNNIFKKIFKINPETSPERAVKIANTLLSMLLFQHIQDKPYVNDILQIKYLLMLAKPDETEQFITGEQIDILNKLDIHVDLEALNKNLFQLYPTQIDDKKYMIALTKYYAGNIDNHDAYYKGIAYCSNLITKFKNENSQLTFNQILFHITKKELTSHTTEEKNDKLIWLNIAKYHLYTVSKYLFLQKLIAKHFDEIPYNIDENTFMLLKKCKIDAVKIYYFSQENFYPSNISLDEKEILLEYSHIIEMENDASRCLKMITAVLFYQAHAKEKLGDFDFIKAELYYKQHMEQFAEEIYIFDAAPPDNFTSYETFKPSGDFSSRSDYTKQFNDYLDNGSSNYESKLLTPLLLSQFDISLEDLSLPPKSWSTFQLYCYDYPNNHRGWSIHDTFVWPEKLNVIQLHSGNYITISEINGNMKINVISEDVYNLSLKENKKENTYFYTKSSNTFLNNLIGPIPPTTKASRNCELKLYEEKEVPALVKTAVQQAIHSSLIALAGYQKDALESVTLTRDILGTFIPFYKEVYYALTDSHYTTNKASLLVDSIFVIPLLRSVGVSLKSLGKVESINFINTLREGINKGLNRAKLTESIFYKISLTYNSHKSALIKNKLTQLIETTMPVKVPPLEIIRKDNILIERPDNQANFPLSAKIKYPVPLKEPGEFGYYKGIYTVPATQEGGEEKYFIKNREGVYQVGWDKNKYTWRLIESKYPMADRYGIPIQYLGPDKWKYNIILRLRGGGIQTQEIITETEQTLLEFNVSSTPAKFDTAYSVENIFNSENVLKDAAIISELTKATQMARYTAVGIVKNAKDILDDKRIICKTDELIRIFTNSKDRNHFSSMLKKLKKALQNFNVKNDIKLVDVENSELFAQISPYHHSADEDKYLAINYSGYIKSKALIFTEEVAKVEKDYFVNENFARTLIHEFTHIKSVAGATDSAGYIEVLKLNGKHNIAKLLIQAKLGLPQVKNNADSLTEIILMLDQDSYNTSFIDTFLEKYRQWEIDVEKRIAQLKNSVESAVADKLHLSWASTVKSEIRQLKEEYDLEMSKQLISEINESNAFFVELQQFE